MATRAAGRHFGEVPTYESTTVGDDLAWILAQLRSAGIEEVIALDLTLPELGIPVARVVIPGLEGPDEHPAYLAGERGRMVAERQP
jgi:ribosomal protein S12 methylthiotransferase accessory factor YcaO